MSIIFWLLLLLFPVTAYAQPTMTKAPLNIAEEDGSPSVYPYQLRVTNGSLVDNGDGTASLSTSSGGGGSGTVGVGTTGRFVIQIGSTTVGTPYNITADSNGNMGIGTVTPSALFNINSSAAQDLFRIDDSAGSDATPFIIDQTGNVGIGTAIPQAVVQISSTLNQALFRIDDNGNGDLDPFIVDASGNVGIGTSNTERDRLLVMGGNVGIGTWVPSTTLDIAGVTVTAGLVSSANVGIGTTTRQAAFVVTNGNVGIGTWTPAGLFEVGPAQFRVSSAGVVTVAGGGTVSFQNSQITTSLANNALWGNTSSGSGSASTFTGGANAGSFGTLRSTSGTGTTDSLRFQTGSSLERERIDTNGNIGIGSWGSNTNFHSLGVVGNVGIGTGLSSTYIVTTAPLGGMVIEGNVGLGTHTPIAPLSVTGHIHSHGTAPTVANNDCGTTSQGTVAAKSTDVAGSMTVGTLAVTTCAMTFNTTWTNAPQCIVIDDSNVLSVKAATTTTKLTVTSTASMSGDVLSYICIGVE